LSLVRTVTVEFACPFCGDRQVVEPPPEGRAINAAAASLRLAARLDGSSERVWSMEVCDSCYVRITTTLLALRKAVLEARAQVGDEG